MNKVKYLRYEFSDKTGTLVEGVAAYRTFSPLGEELQAEQYKIPVIFTPRLYSVEPEYFRSQIDRLYKVYLYDDDALVGFFFLTAITGGKKLQGGRYLFYLEGTDLAGFLIGRTHRGGIYAGARFGSVLRDIMGGGAAVPSADGSIYYLVNMTFSAPGIYVDAALYDSLVTGWLPYVEDARQNLRLLLQLAGARLSWMAGPDRGFGGAVLPYITANFNGSPIEISAYKTYAGDEYAEDEAVSECVVVEHDFRAVAGDTETLYETNGSVSGYLVAFKGPYHSLSATGGLTIDSSGANYAIISGSGTLTGVPYVDYSRRVSANIPGSASGVIKTIDNTLVDSLHSGDLLLRMQNYYTTAQTIKSAMVINDAVAPGSVLRVEDPSGEEVVAYMTKQTAEFSGITKSTGELVAGWSPITGNVFTKVTVMDADGTFTPDAGCTLMRLILIQGGKGGWGGYDGEDATQSSFGSAYDQAGDGGAVGEGGAPGKVLTVDLESADIAASYSVTVGQAGQAGAASHGEGTDGGHSTVTDGETTWTSSDGTAIDGGLFEPLSGKIYASRGPGGVYAGKPGSGSNYGRQTITDYDTGVTGNTTWSSGNSSSIAGGGGPAYGSNGNNASRFNGADGADAVLDGFNGYTAPIGTYGSGGIGGNGAGGGGGTTDVQASGGSGGRGSVGGSGAQGAVLFLQAFGTTPAPVPTPNWLFDADGEPLYDYYYERLAAQED